MDSLQLAIASIVLNIVLAIISYILHRINKNLSGKLQDLSRLVIDFLDAYRDKVITTEEAERLIKDIKKLVSDP